MAWRVTFALLLIISNRRNAPWEFICCCIADYALLRDTTIVAQSIAPFVLGFLYAPIVITEKLASVEDPMAGLFLGEAGR
jgi:hypothetical protein